MRKLDDLYAKLISLKISLSGQLSNPRAAISKDWLSRISHKNSFMFNSYQEFLGKKITINELAERLPRIAVIGDSITTDFHIGSLPSMFWKMWGQKKGNWFMETDKSLGIKSIFERIDEKIPIIAIQHSTPGSRMGNTRTFIDRAINRKNMIHQVDEVISSKVFPDLLLILTGHSAYDWASQVKSTEGGIDKEFYDLTKEFRSKFNEQLHRLHEAAIAQNKKVKIVVFGFINLRPLFELREKIKREKKKNPSLYPYFEGAYKAFKSIRPEYKEKTILLSEKMNKELKKLVLSYRKKHSNVKVIYSDVFSKGDENSIGFVSLVDGWHPSIEGQKKLARIASSSIEKEIKFLISYRTQNHKA